MTHGCFLACTSALVRVKRSVYRRTGRVQWGRGRFVEDGRGTASDFSTRAGSVADALATHTDSAPSQAHSSECLARHLARYASDSLCPAVEAGQLSGPKDCPFWNLCIRRSGQVMK